MSIISLFFIPSLFQADRLWCELALTSTPEARRNCSLFHIEPRTAADLFISIFCKRMFCSSLARISSILVREALLAANVVISLCVVIQ